MDTQAAVDEKQAVASVIPEAKRAAVEAGLLTIKNSMPNVYATIQAKAESIGGEAFALVRRGLAGEPGCFYALEAGHVVGRPFGADDPRMHELARFLVRFGCAHACIFPMTPDEARTYGAD